MFYEWDLKSYDYEHDCDGQAGDIGGLAATRELPADSFCDLHDAVDGGFSFLLLVDTAGGWRGDDSAGGAFAAGAGVRDFTTEFTEGTEAEETIRVLSLDLADLGRSNAAPVHDRARGSV